MFAMENSEDSNSWSIIGEAEIHHKKSFEWQFFPFTVTASSTSSRAWNREPNNLSSHANVAFRHSQQLRNSSNTSAKFTSKRRSWTKSFKRPIVLSTSPSPVAVESTRRRHFRDFSSARFVESLTHSRRISGSTCDSIRESNRSFAPSKAAAGLSRSVRTSRITSARLTRASVLTCKLLLKF